MHAEIPSLLWLRQAYLLMELESPERQKPAIPADLLSEARAAWQRLAKAVTVSDLQADVERVLRRMGEDPSLEYFTDDGFFAVDLAFPGSALSPFAPQSHSPPLLGDQAPRGGGSCNAGGRFKSANNVADVNF